jgi:hypothetical protein
MQKRMLLKSSKEKVMNLINALVATGCAERYDDVFHITTRVKIEEDGTFTVSSVRDGRNPPYCMYCTYSSCTSFEEVKDIVNESEEWRELHEERV